MNGLEEAIKNLVEESATKIADIVRTEHPLILSKIAKDIFDSNGSTHERKWEANKKSTVQKKGFNKRNFETGQLMESLLSPGFLEDDDYMENLPSPKRGGSYGYKAANNVNSPNNRFDDIGRTDSDDKYIADELAKKIGQSFTEVNHG